MSWQYVTTILNTNGALEEALHQIAPSAEDDDGQSKASPLHSSEPQLIQLILIGEIPYQHGDSYHQDTTTDAAFPALSRRNAGEEFMFAQQRTAQVGTRIVHPQENEHRQGQNRIVSHKALRRSVECQCVEQ